MWQRDRLDAKGPHDNNLILPGFTMKVGDILKWLEKKKEQKPAEVCYGPKGDPDPAGVWKPSEEDIIMLKHIIGQYETGNKNSKARCYFPRIEEIFLKRFLQNGKTYYNDR